MGEFHPRLPSGTCTSNTLYRVQVSDILPDASVCFESKVISIVIFKIKFILCSHQPSTPKTSAKKDDVKKAGSKTPQPVRH